MGESEDSFGWGKFLSFRVSYFEGVHQFGKEKEEFLLGQLLPYAGPPTCRQNRNNSVYYPPEQQDVLLFVSILEGILQARH